jgi:hypothetical protein
MRSWPLWPHKWMNGFVSYKLYYKCYYIPSNHQGLVLLWVVNYLFVLAVISFEKETLLVHNLYLFYSSSSFTCIKQIQGLSSDLNWHLLISYLDVLSSSLANVVHKSNFWKISKTYTRYWYGGPDIKEVLTIVYIIRSLILIMCVNRYIQSIPKMMGPSPWLGPSFNKFMVLPLTNWINSLVYRPKPCLPRKNNTLYDKCETIPHGYMYVCNIMTDMRNLGLGWLSYWYTNLHIAWTTCIALLVDF